jgi:phenylpropionate dioxygenase-like ring-hydroxylating dioxygenase large terminal subunit
MQDAGSSERTAIDAASRDLRRVDINPDHWYPLALSSEVKSGTPHAARFAGEPIVLVRTASGAVFALEDRCAHRQIPLHDGVVDGETIRCCYHGWTYDCRGRCVNIPYLGGGRLPNGVRAYPCRELAGLVFVLPGNPALADSTPLPSLDSADSSAYKTRRYAREIACHYSFMHENLMDMNHQFLHRRVMGQMRAHTLGRRRGDDWVEVDYSLARESGRRPLGEALMVRQGPRRSTTGGVMTVRTSYPYQMLQLRTSDGGLMLDLWAVYVPLDREQRTTRAYGLVSIKRPRVRVLLDLAWPLLVWFTERIFKEDRWAVEREQEAHDAQGADWNHEVFPVINELRDLLRRCGAPPRTA